MNKLCKDYSKMILAKFSQLEPIIVFYGSNIYNISSSDLDVCLIFNDEVSEQDKKGLIDETISFQKSRNLRIDEEIPFNIKLVYTLSDLIEIFKESPFKTEKGDYKIDKIEKTPEFLSSKIMKQRLMLNILTTEHRTLNDKKRIIKKYEDLAWKEILKLLSALFKTNLLNLEQVLENLYTNPETGESGEMFLGYKRFNPPKHKYLKKTAKRYIKKL